GVHRWIDVAKVPFISWNLPAGMQVKASKHELQLRFSKITVYKGQRHGVKCQIPGGVPWILPFVWHGDDIVVEHMKPLLVSYAPVISTAGRVGIVLAQPEL